MASTMEEIFGSVSSWACTEQIVYVPVPQIVEDIVARFCLATWRPGYRAAAHSESSDKDRTRVLPDVNIIFSGTHFFTCSFVWIWLVTLCFVLSFAWMWLVATCLFLVKPISDRECSFTTTSVRESVMLCHLALVLGTVRMSTVKVPAC